MSRPIRFIQRQSFRLCAFFAVVASLAVLAGLGGCQKESTPKGELAAANNDGQQTNAPAGRNVGESDQPADHPSSNGSDGTHEPAGDAQRANHNPQHASAAHDAHQPQQNNQHSRQDDQHARQAGTHSPRQTAAPKRHHAAAGNHGGHADSGHTAKSPTTAGHSSDTRSSRGPQQEPDQLAELPNDSPAEADDADPLSIFNKRILPIFKSAKPSSCTECHLSGVDLKDYIRPDQPATFAALRDRGLIDVKNPGESKILTFIARKPEKPSLITEKVRQQELRAFRAWILAAVKEPELLKATADGEPLGAQLPEAVIRHARKDRVLQSFIDNVWLERGRCAGCHSPDRNQKQVREHGAQVSWITLDDPEATLEYMIDAELIDAENPEKSLLLAKPTLQVEHGGGQKLVVGDRTYKQFRRFIDDYAAVVNDRYKSADDLPEPSSEISVASEIWMKFAGVPEGFDKRLLQVDLYRAEGDGWSKFRWASADRLAFGKGKLWQQQLSLTAPRDSKRAEEIRRRLVLPAGRYLAKVYVDRTGKLQKDPEAELGADDLIGQTVVNSRWPDGYGRMTVVDFGSLTNRASDLP